LTEGGFNHNIRIIKDSLRQLADRGNDPPSLKASSYANATEDKSEGKAGKIL